MSIHQSTDGGTLTGLARRWLKTQLQFHGNPQRAYRDRQEADALEQEMRDRAGDEIGRAIFNAVMPGEWKRKINALDEQRAEQELRRSERRRDEHLALPRADVTLTFRGAIRGSIQAEMPARIDWPGEDGVFATIELEPLVSLEAGGRRFNGLRIAMPARDAETGTPVNLSASVERYARHWDPLDAQVWFDDSGDPFFWSDTYGSAHFWPAPGLDMLQFLMPVQNAAGERVSIEGSFSLALDS